MSMLDWNNSSEVQNKGIQIAKGIENIDIFIQPITPLYNKNVWDNCAKILYTKRDDELKPYLISLMEWLQDLNWPGALIILERLKNYQDNTSFLLAMEECVQSALSINDDIWLSNLDLLS